MTPAQNLKCRSLARAIGPDQAEDLALADIEVDAAHGFDLAILFPKLRAPRFAPDAAGHRRRRSAIAIICERSALASGRPPPVFRHPQAYPVSRSRAAL